MYPSTGNKSSQFLQCLIWFVSHTCLPLVSDIISASLSAFASCCSSNHLACSYGNTLFALPSDPLTSFNSLLTYCLLSWSILLQSCLQLQLLNTASPFFLLCFLILHITTFLNSIDFPYLFGLSFSLEHKGTYILICLLSHIQWLKWCQSRCSVFVYWKNEDAWYINRLLIPNKRNRKSGLAQSVKDELHHGAESL